MTIFRLILVALGIWIIFRMVKALRRASEEKSSRVKRGPSYEEGLGEIEDAEYEDIIEDEGKDEDGKDAEDD